MIGIKTIIFVVVLAIALYRASFVFELMKVQEVVYSHAPGPCRDVKIRNDSCENVANDADCNEWVTRGECQNNPDWMNINCAKACGQCEHPGKPLLGSEDMASLGDGKYLISSGLRVEEYQVPDRRGAIFLFDFNKPKDGVQQAKMVWDDEKIETLNPHGISTFIAESGKVYVFLVNHVGETVERFEYEATSNTLTHLDTFADASFKFLHSVQATGENSCYVTDYGGSPNLILFTGLRLGKVFHVQDGESKMVLNDFYLPTGLQISADKKNIYLAHMGRMTLETYSIQDDFTLEKVHTLVQYKSILNIQVDPVTSDLWLGSVPAVLQWHEYSHEPESDASFAASQVLRVKSKSGIPTYDINDVYTNSGDEIKGASVAMHYNNKLVIGSTFHKTILCDILHI